ncbi:MAG TPA: AarF/ABC1/UbiB kinase family protein [Patescibacteria group bacterium]|nr:AarF/ABC1/UbiB kinase family protein [Patescibacteria group bacterium]
MNARREIRRIKYQRRKTIAKTIAKVTRYYAKGDKDAMFGCICDSFVKLGGIYVKFLQGVLLQSSQFQNWLEANRYKIFENLDPDPIDIYVLVNHQLGERANQFKMISRVPFAAGSFGQVYLGELSSGEQVIIKVLRPFIRETLRYDTKILGRFGWFFIKTVTTLDANMKAGVRYVFDTTMRETDYINEAKAAERMYEAFKDDPQIVIPKTYSDLCTSQILVQEYIGGLSVADLIASTKDGVSMRRIVRERTGSDLEEQIASLGYKFFSSLFTKGITHGDLHPGNVRLLPDNKVGMLDFGITVEKPAQPYVLYKFLEQFDKATQGKAQPADMFLEYVRLYQTDLFYALEAIDTYTKNKYDIVSKLKTHINKVFFDTNDPQEFANTKHDAFIGATINKTVNRSNRFGIVAHLKNADVLRAAQTYHTLATSLDAFHLIAPVYSAVVADMKEFDPSITRPMANPLSIDQALEIVSRWLERVAERDGALFRTIQGLIRQGVKDKELAKN